VFATFWKETDKIGSVIVTQHSASIINKILFYRRWRRNRSKGSDQCHVSYNRPETSLDKAIGGENISFIFHFPIKYLVSKTSAMTPQWVWHLRIDGWDKSSPPHICRGYYILILKITWYYLYYKLNIYHVSIKLKYILRRKSYRHKNKVSEAGSKGWLTIIHEMININGSNLVHFCITPLV